MICNRFTQLEHTLTPMASVQAIGWALYEDIVWRPDGSIANARMTNYIVPTDDPKFTASFGLQFDHPAGFAGNAPFPAAAFLIITALAVLGAVAGLVGFGRRDLGTS